MIIKVEGVKYSFRSQRLCTYEASRAKYSASPLRTNSVQHTSAQVDSQLYRSDFKGCYRYLGRYTRAISSSESGRSPGHRLGTFRRSRHRTFFEGRNAFRTAEQPRWRPVNTCTALLLDSCPAYTVYSQWSMRQPSLPWASAEAGSVCVAWSRLLR